MNMISKMTTLGNFGAALSTSPVLAQVDYEWDTQRLEDKVSDAPALAMAGDPAF